MEQNELLMEIRVECGEAASVRGQETTIVMIPFTGTTEGPYFCGKTVGTGVDTQRIGEDGIARLSARYMLEGTDKSGQSCRIFIENQGSFDTGFTPTVVTDSALLSDWETAALRATVDVVPGGVAVRVFREGGRP